MSRFERERRTYEREKPRLLASEGDYVVILGEDILGHWPSRAEAYVEGRRAYGRRPFMLTRIAREEPVYFQPFIGVSGRGTTRS
jgi:hypothetical protein